jgi:hypothetical protein
LCYRPTVFFHQLRLVALALPQKIGAGVKEFLIFSTCLKKKLGKFEIT